MSLPAERVRATRGGTLSSILGWQPAPVWSNTVDAKASLRDGNLVLESDERDWVFELLMDAVFEEVDEGGPTLYCKHTTPGRRNDPTKLHFGSAAERTAWKRALEAARDAAQRP